jgi:[CysO sulfur-carrier protein]-S-L-cysteine hydrolase
VVTTESFVIRIPRSIYGEMLAHVIAAYPNEGCGALGYVDGCVVKNYPTANAAAHPDDFSEIDTYALLDIFKDIDEYDGKMIYYHSHPVSEAYPSPRDKQWAKDSANLYLIFSLYPQERCARIFEIEPDETVLEGKIELV